MAKYIFFCSHKNGSHPQFSNWFPCKYISSDGIEYPCSEIEFMHKKALYFNDQETAAEIIESGNPEIAKKLGRRIAGFNENKWALVREDIMYNAVKAKFSVPEMRDILLATGDAIIVEAADYDKIWGIGFKEEDAIANINKWGQNLLGNILTQVRNELKI